MCLASGYNGEQQWQNISIIAVLFSAVQGFELRP
jgi:hypothetical protein